MLVVLGLDATCEQYTTSSLECPSFLLLAFGEFLLLLFCIVCLFCTRVMPEGWGVGAQCLHEEATAGGIFLPFIGRQWGREGHLLAALLHFVPLQVGTRDWSLSSWPAFLFFLNRGFNFI